MVSFGTSCGISESRAGSGGTWRGGGVGETSSELIEVILDQLTFLNPQPLLFASVFSTTFSTSLLSAFIEFIKLSAIFDCANLDSEVVEVATGGINISTIAIEGRREIEAIDELIVERDGEMYDPIPNVRAFHVDLGFGIRFGFLGELGASRGGGASDRDEVTSEARYLTSGSRSDSIRIGAFDRKSLDEERVEGGG